MYTERNFRTKKQLKEFFESGRPVYCYQEGPFPGTKTGKIALEGPHYPEPHRWYASGEIVDGKLIRLQGSRARWDNDTFVPAPAKKPAIDGFTPAASDYLGRIS